jgi:MFS family permease
MRASYAAVLRVRHARPLLLAALLGRLSYAMAPLALVLQVHAATGSFARAGAASAVTALTSGVLAPVRGRLVDRYGQRRCLPPFALVYAVALGAVAPLAGPGPVATVATMLLAALAGAAAPPLAASMRVLWASLLGQGAALQTAYALDAVLEETVYTVGPLVAGGLAAAVDPAASLPAAAGLCLAGTLAFAASPVSQAWSGRQEGAPVGRAGAMAAPGIRIMVASLVGVGVANGIWDIGLVAAARDHGSAATGGVLLALMSAGSAAGGLLYGARSWRRPAGQRYLILLALLCLACAPMVVAPGLVALGAAAALVGLALAPAISSAYVLAAELAPAGTMTEAATWVTTASNVTAAGGIALAGALVDEVGVAWTLATAWAGATAALLVTLAGRARLGAARYRGKHEPRRAGARQARRTWRIL